MKSHKEDHKFNTNNTADIFAGLAALITIIAYIAMSAMLAIIFNGALLRFTEPLLKKLPYLQDWLPNLFKLSSLLILSLYLAYFQDHVKNFLSWFAKPIEQACIALGFPSQTAEITSPKVQRIYNGIWYERIRSQTKSVYVYDWKSHFLVCMYFFMSALAALQGIDVVSSYVTEKIEKQSETYSNQYITFYPVILPRNKPPITPLPYKVSDIKLSYFFESGGYKKNYKKGSAQQCQTSNISDVGIQFDRLSSSFTDKTVTQDVTHLIQSLSYCTSDENSVEIVIAGYSSASEWTGCQKNESKNLNRAQAIKRSLKIESIFKDALLQAQYSSADRRTPFENVAALKNINVQNVLSGIDLAKDSEKSIQEKFVAADAIFGHFSDVTTLEDSNTKDLNLRGAPSPYSLRRAGLITVTNVGICTHKLDN